MRGALRPTASSAGRLAAFALLVGCAELAEAGARTRTRTRQSKFASDLMGDAPPAPGPAPAAYSAPAPPQSPFASGPAPPPFDPRSSLPSMPTLPTMPGLPSMSMPMPSLPGLPNMSGLYLPPLSSVLPAVSMPGWSAVEYVVSLLVYFSFLAGSLYGLCKAVSWAYQHCVRINCCLGKQCADSHFYRVGTTVWVRDEVHHDWRKAKVVGFQDDAFDGEHPVIKPSGWDFSKGHTWKQVVKEDPHRGNVRSPESPAAWLFGWGSGSPRRGQSPRGGHSRRHIGRTTSGSDSEDDFQSPTGRPRNLPGSPMKSITERYKQHADAMSPNISGLSNPWALDTSGASGTLGSLTEHLKVLDDLNPDALSQTLQSLNKSVSAHERHEYESTMYDDGHSPEYRAHSPQKGSSHSMSGLQSTYAGLESYSQYEEPTTWESAVRPQTKVLARLVCVEGESNDYDMCKTQVVLGRQPTGKTPKPGTGPDFPVSNDKTISRKHAQITCHDHLADDPVSFRMECLCKNSLLVNQQPVEQGNQRKLRTGDIIQIGQSERPIRLRFQLSSDQRGVSPPGRAGRHGRSPSRGPGPLRLEPAGTPSRANQSSFSEWGTTATVRDGPALTARRQLAGPVLGTFTSSDDGSTFQITRPETVIGRTCADPKADCLLRADKQISRQHLKIRADTAPKGTAAYQNTTMRVGPPVRGELEVTVIMCMAVCPADNVNYSNPKVRLAMAIDNHDKHGWQNTQTARNTVSPSFDETFLLTVPAHPEPMERTLYLEVNHDESVVGEPKLLGELTLDLDLEGTNGCFGGDWSKTVDGVWPLEDPNRKVPPAWIRQKQQQASIDHGFGSVHLRIRFIPDRPSAMSPMSGLDSMGSARFWLECIGRNNAIINGQQVLPDSGPQELFDRDRIMVGSVSFAFEVGADRPDARVADRTADRYRDDGRSRHQTTSPQSRRKSPSRSNRASPTRSSNGHGMLNSDDRVVIDAIFDYINVKRRNELTPESLKQFKELHHDPESFEHAMEGVLDDILRVSGRGRGGLTRAAFVEWFAARPSTHRLVEVMSLFREKWIDDWASMTYGERQTTANSAQYHLPPAIADLSMIRQEMQAIVSRSSSAGLSSSVYSADIGMLEQAAERKIRDGCHPNKMLDWISLFNHPEMREAARKYKRIEDLCRLPLSENYINAVDTVWMVNNRFRPSNPYVPKLPPSMLSALEDKIEGGEFDVNEIILGPPERKQELNLRGEDKLSPLLLLATGHYQWAQPTFDLMKTLLDRGADANKVDERGFNSLFYIVERAPFGRSSPGLKRITEQLLDRTDLSHRDEAMRTVLHLCVEREGSETTALRPQLLSRAQEMRLDPSDKDSLVLKLERLDDDGVGGGRGSPKDRERKGDAQAAARTVMEHLRESKAKMRDIKKMFKDIDANGDGKLSPMEFAKGLRQQTSIDYDLSMQLADQLMMVMDRNNDNSIDVYEFLNSFRAEQIIRKFRDKLRGQDVHGVFDAMDTNQNGVLSGLEFAQGLEQLGITKGLKPNEIDDIMDLIDMDGNNAIDFQEFVAVIGHTGGGGAAAGGHGVARSPSRPRERRGSNASHHSATSHRSDRST